MGGGGGGSEPQIKPFPFRKLGGLHGLRLAPSCLDQTYGKRFYVFFKETVAWDFFYNSNMTMMLT